MRSRTLALYGCLFFLVMCIAACAADSAPHEGNESVAPVPRATIIEVPGDAPALNTPTPPLIAIASRSDITNPDGTITQNLTLQDNSLGVGQVLIQFPPALGMGEGGIVTLTLFPAPSAIGNPLAPVTETGTTSSTQSITETTEIYPVMKADLTGTTFSIEMDGEPQRLVTTDTPTEWLWSIQPRESGTHTLIASLSIPVLVEGSTANTSRVVETFPITIEITKTFAQRMDENMEVILTTVLGVLGGGLTLGWRTWRNRFSRKAG